MKNRNLRSSFAHAISGLRQAFKSERNIKLHCLSGLIATLLAIVLDFTLFEWMLVVFTVGFVVVAELLNTAIEYTVDLVCRNTYNELAKYSKDIAAGATLVAAIVAVIVGCGLYLPKIWTLLF